VTAHAMARRDRDDERDPRALAIELFGLAFDDGAPALAVREASGAIVAINARAAALLGGTIEGLRGRRFADVMARSPRSTRLDRVRDDGGDLYVLVELDAGVDAGRLAERAARAAALAIEEARLRAAVAAAERDATARDADDRERVRAAFAAGERAQRERDHVARRDTSSVMEDALASLAAALARAARSLDDLHDANAGHGASAPAVAEPAVAEPAVIELRRRIEHGLELCARAELELASLHATRSQELPSCSPPPRP